MSKNDIEADSGLDRKITQTKSIVTSNSFSEILRSLAISNRKMVSSLSAGVVSAVVFNPYDLAFLRSIKYNRSFWKLENFKNPFKAYDQSILYRVSATGSFYFFQAVTQERVKPILKNNLGFSDAKANSVCGVLTGCGVSLVANVFAFVRSQSWIDNSNQGFAQKAAFLYKYGGGSVFFRGIESLMLRNMIFAGVYEPLRHILAQQELIKMNSFFSNLLAASFATVLSSPFNFAKTVQHGVSPGDAVPSVKQALSSLYRDVKSHAGPKISYLNSRTLMWLGAIRHVIGTGASQGVADKVAEEINKLSIKEPSSRGCTR